MSLQGNADFVDAGLDQPSPNPLEMFHRWLQEADRVRVRAPRSLSIASVDAEGRPTARVVMLKQYDDLGFVFGSSGAGPKGRHFELIPWASGTFWWRETIQQVLFTGPVVRLEASISGRLFGDRRRDARATATISHQSEPLTDESALRSEIARLIESQDPIQRPPHWH